ncbi:MAG: response regulator [Gemmatimonadetes bacterium]|jgi:CheY-like chemotaxis protein|nr:response regulator [Gemmatimonadota bacterium]
MDSNTDGRCRVLIADDVKVNALVIAAILKREGYGSEIAQDGEQCLEMARSVDPEIIILDLMMPKIHGLEVLKRLKSDEGTRHIGVIVCTAKGFETEQNQAQDLGALGFLEKPVDARALIALIDGFFSGGQAAQAIGTPGPLSESPDDSIFSPAIRADHGSFRFWGTRGSTGVSGSRYVQHGGNTSCLSIDHDGDLIIFDAGSGIRDLGLEIMSRPPGRIHLFITHTHWDHIQGFPFFTPAYVPGYDITIYASPNVEKGLESIFRGQLDRAYFPVQLEDMQANLDFVDLAGDAVEIGGVKISWEYTLHPSAAVGYKADIDGRTLVYVPDNEFLKGFLSAPDTITRDHDRFAIHKGLTDFVANVDVLIHEAQYTNEEYVTKVGWGHTSISNACALVKLSGAKRWLITHHDPTHDDEFLQGKLNLTRQLLHDLGCNVEVAHAYDGMVGYL